MKRILDTVHGYILVSDDFIDNIIDTRCFQRLRRIEQTSIRAVYPSARHDRFIHSLGVYHIGSMIVEHLRKESAAHKYWHENKATMEVIYGSYLAACLLHDIAHAPFSHTFEKYYGQQIVLRQLLKDEMQDETFASDLDITVGNDEPNFHEYMSAYVANHIYADTLKRMSYDPELVVRMITGVFYNNGKDNHQIHNCFISLLHGSVIDADRLDYACRDVWASGYSTSSIDLRRLISALHIEKKGEDYVVCFESNSLNEIEGVLNVKDFQMRYVINHHTVNYEQWLLQSAAKQMAHKYFPAEEDADLALGKIICKESVIDGITVGEMRVTNISDDDLIFLIKQDTDNLYYKEWCERTYSYFALWKSPDEFYHYFDVKRGKNLKHNEFEEVVKETLKNNEIGENDIRITLAKFKPRVKMDSLYIIVSQDVIRYTELYPDSGKKNEDVEFYYVFVKKNGLRREEIQDQRRTLVSLLKGPIETLYKEEEERG